MSLSENLQHCDLLDFDESIHHNGDEDVDENEGDKESEEKHNDRCPHPVCLAHFVKVKLV